jgi:hypothetical protein
MITRILFFYLCCFLISNALLSQSIESSQNSIDIGVAFGKSQGALSAAYNHDWFIGKKKKFVIGLGGRFSGYVAQNQYYVTAPAKLTSGSTGLGVIFKENIEANMDSFLISNPAVFAINAFVNIGYRINEKLAVGFNIDAIGFSFGGEKSGNYINGSQGQVSNARPTSFNALLTSDNDLGSLNSELYAKYKISDRWSIRGGLQFLFTEYTTTTEVQQIPEPNDRFRNKSLMFMVGTSFNLK